MDIKIPEVGESVYEATISRWHKKDGDSVRKDDLLCELETDKISLEINAEADGILSIRVPEGETAEVGSLIGVIDETAAPKEEDEKAEPEKPEREKKLEKRKEVEEKREKPAKEEEKTEKEPQREPEKEPEREEIPSPAAEKGIRRAEEEGRITRKPMSPIRRRIAERLVAVRQQTAMLTTFNEADMSRVLTVRKKHRESFRKKHGVDLGLMSFFIKASTEALKEFPEVNARIEGEDLLFQHFYDIGIAVGAERGLVVPVIRNADEMHFAEIEQTINDFVERIRANRLDLKDLEGGTFTITNGGVYGSLLSTPILNPPQSAVLGMHAIQERAVVREGEVTVRPMMYLALSYDHRIIDGRQAVTFLKRIKDYVEEPEEMLLEL